MAKHLSYWGDVYLRRAEAMEGALQSSEQNVSAHPTNAEAEQRIDYADAVTALYMEVPIPLIIGTTLAIGLALVIGVVKTLTTHIENEFHKSHQVREEAW
jgi:hypothetical protein